MYICKIENDFNFCIVCQFIFQPSGSLFFCCKYSGQILIDTFSRLPSALEAIGYVLVFSSIFLLNSISLIQRNGLSYLPITSSVTRIRRYLLLAPGHLLLHNDREVPLLYCHFLQTRSWSTLFYQERFVYLHRINEVFHPL